MGGRVGALSGQLSIVDFTVIRPGIVGYSYPRGYNKNMIRRSSHHDF